MRPRSVAITGLDTFAGQRLAARLLAWDPPVQVVGLDVRLPRRLDGHVRFYPVDLTDPTADSVVAEIFEKENIDCVFHAAFHEHPVEPELSHELEVVGSLHVMNAAASAHVRKLVVTSTAQVYGPRADNPNFLSESHALRPHAESHAARDRAEVEALLAIFAERHPDLVVTSLRPCWIMGPTIDSVATRYFEPSTVTTVLGYDPLMQILHEEDWLDAAELVLERDVAGPINLAGDGVLPLSTLLRVAGKGRRARPHPWLYRFEYLAHLNRTGDAPAAFYDHLRFLWVVDTQRSKTELAWTPEYTTKEAWMSFAVSRRLRRYQ